MGSLALFGHEVTSPYRGSLALFGHEVTSPYRGSLALFGHEVTSPSRIPVRSETRARCILRHVSWR